MESFDETDNSLPFIDDMPTDDEINANQYNLKIIENYQNKNRNIEITNQCADEVMNKSLSPVAPLAEETELSDSRLSDSQDETCQNHKSLAQKHTGMKLVIKGCNSIISIQGLDNKSSITFKRKNGRIHSENAVNTVLKKEKSNGNIFKMKSGKPIENSKKGRWKMLTRSLISKSARFERRGLDERYPKYVLLKNEEDMAKEEDIYPKMVLFDGIQSESRKSNEEVKSKPEFNFKKSFKNKTKPVVPIDEILTKSVKDETIVQSTKKPLTERSHRENRNPTIKQKIIVEKRKSFKGEKMALSTGKSSGNESEMAFNVTGCSPPQGQVFNEIQGIIEDTLKLYPEAKPPPFGFGCVSSHAENTQQQQDEYYTPVPPQFCPFSCHDPQLYPPPNAQPPVYVPVYEPYCKPRHLYKHCDTQTNEMEFEVSDAVLEDNLKIEQAEKEVDFPNLPLGLLSTFLPRVVIMKTFLHSNTENQQEENELMRQQCEADCKPANNDMETCEDRKDNMTKERKTLELPQSDFTVKSKMFPEEKKPETEIASPSSGNPYINCLTLNEITSSDDEGKTKTEDSEATEYLHYSEAEPSGNESVKPTTISEPPSKSKDNETNQENDKTSKNLTLTKVGYKMYDNLTKLSLKREKEIIEKPETTGCGCKGKETTKSPYNITLESNNRVVKVTVPENELNFKILNSGEGEIQIGMGGIAAEEKKIVRKSELWHPDNGRKELAGSGSERGRFLGNLSKGHQKIKLSLADNKEVVVSIEMDEREKINDKNKKSTKEIKVGTDDFDLAGGDFSSTLGGNNKDLSPRTGQLLKNLQETLRFCERERKFLTEKINEKLTDQKFQGGILPGVFLVKQISPRICVPKKRPEVPFLKNTKKVPEVKDPGGKLREYYCEECLATMRIFEDENPSVKSMVDKFETIIQLESC